MLNAAVVGCGCISEMHLDAIINAGSRVYAVCDIDKDKLSATAKKYSALAVSDYDDLLSDPEIDVIHICTPHYLHCDMVVSALEAGKNVFCEKPMAINSEEAERMASVAERTGKLFGVCFQNRYLEANAAAKEIITTEDYGKVKGIKAFVTWCRDENYYKSGDWRGKWETEGGGVLINQAIHTLDLIGWMLGDIVSVSGNTAQFALGSVIETEDSAMVMLRNKEGAKGILFATNSYVGNSEVEMEIVLERATLKLKGDLWVYDENGEVIKTVKTERLGGEKSYWGVGHKRIVADFHRCIEENRCFSVDQAEGKRSIKMLDCVYRGKKFDVI